MQHSLLDKLIGASFATGILGVTQMALKQSESSSTFSGWGPLIPGCGLFLAPLNVHWREQRPAPFCLHARISLSICPCPVPNPHKLPGWWCSTQQVMQQTAGSFHCHYAWTSSMRDPKHEVAGVWWRVGVPARMDGARTFSYMIECQSWGGHQTSTQEVPPSVNSRTELRRGRCLLPLSIWVTHGSGRRRRAGRTGNAKAECLDVISHPESSPGQLLTHLGLSFVHSQWTFWKDLLLNSSAILQCQQTWCSEVANEAWPWQSFFIPPWGGVSQTPLERLKGPRA